MKWSGLGLLFQSKPSENGLSQAVDNYFDNAWTKPRSGFPGPDAATGLPWYSDINSKRPDYILGPMPSGRAYPDPERYWREYAVYEPSELEQIRLYVNRLYLTGFRAMRLLGTTKMGILTLGEGADLRDAYSAVKRSEKMIIQGELHLIPAAK